MEISPMLPKSSNKDIEKVEKDFQEALDAFWHTDINAHTTDFYKQQTDTMWWCVYYTCANLCKSIYKKRHVIVQDIDEVIMDATEYTMRFILGKNKKNRIHLPRSLKSFCFLRCRYIIDNPKRKWYDKNMEQMPEDNYREVDMVIADE